MIRNRTEIERRIQVAGVFVMIGILIEFISLLWNHPTAFIIYLLAGGVCMFVGILYYLISLVNLGNSE